MPGVIPAYDRGPVTYEVNATVAGGQLVMPDTGGKIKPATTGAVSCLGVATTDAVPVGTSQTQTVVGTTSSDLMASPISQYVAVAMKGVWSLTAQGAINFGDRVIVGTTSVTVAAAGATPDARTVVGYCVEPLGISNGAKGLIELTL